MLRSCIVCRQKSAKLLSFFLNEESKILLGRSQQRNGWICPVRSCIQKLEKKTARLSKYFHRSNIKSNSLLLQAQKRIKCNVEKQLMLSLNSGVVCSGSYEILQKKNKLILMITSSNKIKKRWSRQNLRIPIFSLNIGTFELGSLIRKGPRSIVGILPNCHSILLSENLHLLEELR